MECYRCKTWPCKCADGITLLWGDCREILPELDAGSVVCITDPPYIVHAGKGGGCFGSRRHLVETGGFTDGGVDYSFLSQFADWFCFCSLKQLVALLQVAERSERMHLLTWNKPNPVPTCNNKYLPDVEYIVHGFQHGRLFGEYADKSTFFVYPCGRKETRHPNEKPVSLIAKLVRLGSGPKDIVCDPYCGSGTTGRACKDLGRKCIMIEIEEKYCKIAAERLRQEILF